MTVYHRELSDREKVKSRRGKRSKEKGKRGEKECADIFREMLCHLDAFEVVQRNQGKWSGKHRPEVAVCPIGNYHDHLIHIECKWQKNIGWKKAMEQATADAMPGSIAVVVGKYDGTNQYHPEPPMVLVRLREFLPMLALWLKEQEEQC